MRQLTTKEIESVSGAIGPLGGAVLGGGSYVAMNMMTGQPVTFSGFAGSATLGFVSSGLSSLGPVMTGVANVAKHTHSVAIGTLSGAAVSGSLSNVGGGGSRTGGSRILVSSEE
jgi:hypothetical protein